MAKGRGWRKRYGSGSAAYGYGGGPAHRPLDGPEEEALWTRLQPPDGCPPSWRDWRESLPPHVLERLAEASLPPPALRVAGSKRPRRSVVAAHDVSAIATSTDGDATDPPNVATKFVVEPTMTQSLPPVVLPSPPADNDATDALASIPEAVRHLPLDSTVDIFDRKMGKVLSGRSAVPVRHLAAVLRTHASYEPIVPPPPIEEAAAEAVAEAARRAVTVRQGRTAPNVTVSATVEPQERVRVSANEGREVIVTEGRLRGLVGKIEACLPGGWYVVSDLLGLHEQGVEHVVSSASLDLLDAKSHMSTVSLTNTLSEGESALPPAKNVVETFHFTIEKLYSLPIRQMTLRLEAMTDEKDKIASDIGLDEKGKVRDIDEAKASTGLHGLRIYQRQQRWERLDKDIKDTRTKLSEYRSVGEEIQGGVATMIEDQSG